MKKKHHNQFVRCLENIQDLSGQGLYEYAIKLNSFMISRKTISYNPKTKKYKIINHIDDSKQYLTDKQMMNEEYTNIGKAMKLRALIAEID